MPSYARHAGHLAESETLVITARAHALRAKGVEVAPFAAGEPDFPTPAHVAEAAVQAIRAKGKPGTKVGPAENIETAVPLIEAPEHIRAAQAATRESNAPFLTVMLEGRYTDTYLRNAGADAPKFTDNELRIIGSPLDFVGINVYCPMFYVLASGQAPGWRVVPYAKGHAKAAINNFPISPECLYWAPKFVQSLWGQRKSTSLKTVARATRSSLMTATYMTPTASCLSVHT